MARQTIDAIVDGVASLIPGTLLNASADMVESHNRYRTARLRLEPRKADIFTGRACAYVPAVMMEMVFFSAYIGLFRPEYSSDPEKFAMVSSVMLFAKVCAYHILRGLEQYSQERIELLQNPAKINQQ
jgi:hypothetical protein